MKGDSRENREMYQRKMLFALFTSWQFFLHLMQCLKSGDPRMWMPHIVAWLHDILVLGGILAVGGALIRFIPKRVRPVFSVVVLVLLFCAEVLLSLYPQLLREYVGFPVNIFAADSATAWMTLSNYLGLQNIWPVVFVAGAGCFVFLRQVPGKPALGRQFVTIAFLSLLVMAGLATLPRSPHPLVSSIRLQLTELTSSESRVVPSLSQVPSQEVLGTSQEHKTPSIADASPIDHVFLVVLEGVTSDDFEREFMTRKNGFYQRVKERSAWFNNYHTTNLDSYTSLIAMLTGVQVPYRSYSDVSLYDHVNKTDNLTRTFRNRGHYGLFISTYAEQPFVPTRADWNKVMDRDDLPSLDGWLSLGSSRMEQATEDMAALDVIVQTAADNPRSFVLHELVYGHSTEWRAKTGKSQLAYYDEYLTGLLDRLEAKGLDSRSLVVVVSDHGDRTKASDVENYRVPLLIAGNNINSSTDTAFRSHLDLPAIVASRINNTSLPAPRQEAFVVGSTERWIYGEITADKKHLIVDDQTGTVLSASGFLSATTVNQKFQASLYSFCTTFPREVIASAQGYQMAEKLGQ